MNQKEEFIVYLAGKGVGRGRLEANIKLVETGRCMEISEEFGYKYRIVKEGKNVVGRIKINGWEGEYRWKCCPPVAHDDKRMNI